MEHVIHKFRLEPTIYLQALELTAPAEILSAGAQGDDIVVWATVTTGAEARPQKRLVQIVMTGSPRPLDARFINTVFIGNLVFHIFEVHP